jgi:hypothetical protein
MRICRPLCKNWEKEKKVMRQLALAKIRQHFPRPRIEDITAVIEQQMKRFVSSVRPGMRVAITAGSRGITGIPFILKTIAESLHSVGAKPFLVAAMGSHGGGTVEGQTHILEHLGITESTIGVPLRITSDAVAVGTTPSGHTLYVDQEAFKADAIFPVNRVKLHTAFQDRLGSGIFKMLTVGLGKVPGATQVHKLNSTGMYASIVEMGHMALQKLPIIGGLAIVENGYEETAWIEGFLPSEIEEGEKKLLQYAAGLLPRLPVQALDVLIVDEMGKNYSGTGMDTNVIGRWKATGLPEPEWPKIRRIVVLRLSKESQGNANGLGLADVTTKRLVEAIDWNATLMNVRTTGFWDRAFCPPFPGSDRDAIEWSLRGMKVSDEQPISIARIRNTLHLEELWLNETAFASAQTCDRVSNYTPLSFDKHGNLEG